MKKSETRIRRLLLVGGVGAATAAVVNAAIYGIGRAADVTYTITVDNSGVQSVRLADVLSLTLMSFAVGIVAAVVATRLRRPSLRVLQILGSVLAVVTIWGDFTIDGTNAAKALLASMHIVVGVAYVASLQITRSSSVQPAHGSRTETDAPHVAGVAA